MVKTIFTERENFLSGIVITVINLQYLMLMARRHAASSASLKTGRRARCNRLGYKISYFVASYRAPAMPENAWQPLDSIPLL